MAHLHLRSDKDPTNAQCATLPGYYRKIEFAETDDQVTCGRCKLQLRIKERNRLKKEIKKGKKK